MLAITNLSPGLHRVGNDLVALHLVVTDEGVTVIDTGLPGHWRPFLGALTSLGRTLDDVRGVVLTHGDSDHIGFAERLRAATRVPVYVHEGDAARAMGEKPPATGPEPKRLGALLEFGWEAIRRNGLRTRHLTEVVTVRDGDVLDLPGSPRVLAMPGHSPGSIAVHVPLVDALFVGDALTTRNVLTGVSGPQPAPFTDDPAGAIATLDRLDGLDAAWVLPGHGAPWTGGVPALVAGIREVATAR